MSVIRCMSDDLFAELERDVIRRDVVCAILSKLRRHRIAVDFERLSTTRMNIIFSEKYDPVILIDIIRFICKYSRNGNLYRLFANSFFCNPSLMKGISMVFRAFIHHGVVPHLKDLGFKRHSIVTTDMLREHEYYACFAEVLGTGYEFEDIVEKNRILKQLCANRWGYIGTYSFKIRQVETSFYIARLVEY